MNICQQKLVFLHTCGQTRQLADLHSSTQKLLYQLSDIHSYFCHILLARNEILANLIKVCVNRNQYKMQILVSRIFFYNVTESEIIFSSTF